MKRQIMLIIVILIGVLVILGPYFLANFPCITEGGPGYTIDDVINHAINEDCWTTIDGKVYDITDYISKHPVESTILQACGVDASLMFETKGGIGDMHSEFAKSQLACHYIGEMM